MKDEIIEYYKKSLDRSLIAESLKLTPEQRMERLEQMALLVDEIRKARKEQASDRLPGVVERVS
jgi:hypothetical protein